MDMQAKTDEFNKLSYDEKLKMCHNILSVLSEKGNAQASKILGSLSRIKKIPETLLNTIFTDFEASVENIKEGKMQEELHMFEQSKTYMDNLRAKEEQDRLSENPEDILSQINNI